MSGPRSAPESALPSVMRPDGRLYRPRKLTAEGVDTDDGNLSGVLVFGTHDPETARPLADEFAVQQAGQSYRALDPVPGWWRSGFAGGEQCWIGDEKSGRAAVLFQRIDEEG
jgi:hypothetical protein